MCITKTPSADGGRGLLQCFSRRATTYFPTGMHQSIIGADVFHDLVRDGAGWFNVATVTLEKH